MDRLPEALAVRLGNRIVYRAAVREICQSERGVWVIYADAKGQTHRVDADYCVSTISLPVLRGIEKDLSQAVQSATAASVYDSACGVNCRGLQEAQLQQNAQDEVAPQEIFLIEIGTLIQHRVVRKVVAIVLYTLNPVPARSRAATRLPLSD